MSSKCLCKTSSRRLGRCKIVTLKTCWRRLQDQKFLLGLHCKYLHFVRWSLTNHSLIGNIIILEKNFEIFDRLNFCKSIIICNTLKTYVHKFSLYNLWYTLEEKKSGVSTLGKENFAIRKFHAREICLFLLLVKVYAIIFFYFY